MKQFFAYVNRNPRSASAYPYLLNIQSDFINGLDTLVMVPLYRVSIKRIPSADTLSPMLTLAGKSYMMMTPLMSVIDKAAIGKQAHDVTDQKQSIMAALDFLISGI